ncbi:unnamed protein product [Trichobilharzia szidati]|nr:unnamed protein product [Trichobilharzia szidati]
MYIYISITPYQETYHTSVTTYRMLIILLTVFCLINNFDLSTALAVEDIYIQKENVSWGCGMCEAGLSFLRYLMTDNYLREVYILAGNSICDLIPPGRTQDVCSTYVEKYLLEVLNTIGKASKPEELCVDFQACNATKVTKYFTERDDFDSCRKCQVLSKSVSKLMHSTEFSETLQESIQSGCSFFEGYKDQCMEYSKSLLDNVKEIVHFNLGRVCKVSCR